MTGVTVAGCIGIVGISFGASTYWVVAITMAMKAANKAIDS
jgi:hypothetical protein